MPRSVAALILAAGGSTRFGEPKQLIDWEGESLIRRAVRAATEGGCSRAVVVVGAAGEAIALALRETSAELVFNPDWKLGLGTSIRSGVQHLFHSRELPEAILLLACDQPSVDGGRVSSLISCWENSENAIVASRYAGTLGVPALFDRSCFTALLELPDDSGAKAILRARPGDVAELPFENGAFDIDTPADYARAQWRLKS